jgi:hypothetical protein
MENNTSQLNSAYLLFLGCEVTNFQSMFNMVKVFVVIQGIHSNTLTLIKKIKV